MAIELSESLHIKINSLFSHCAKLPIDIFLIRSSYSGGENGMKILNTAKRSFYYCVCLSLSVVLLPLLPFSCVFYRVLPPVGTE